MITERGVAGAKSRANQTKREIRLSESLGRGSGSLVLKATPGSAHWYYRYAVDHKSSYIPIGQYGDHWTLERARKEARSQANERSTLPDGDLRAHRAHQEAAELTRIEAQRRAEELEQSHTLVRLIEIYAGHLESVGKTAAPHARRALRKHVIEAWPDLANIPAHKLTRLQVTTILRTIIEAGHGRMAAVVRAYLRAAYAMALKAEGDSKLPASLLSFNISSNPVADTASLSDYNNVRDRALSETEIRAYWRRLASQDGLAADGAKIQILCAGQRFEQLLRAKVENYNDEAKTLTLYDPKGKRKKARIHVIPLPAPAAEIIERLVKRANDLASTYLFAFEPDKPMHSHTLTRLISAICAELVSSGEVTTRFMAADLRRSVETLLASMGVSRDTRAQIQSHGLSGVQARHYDRHDYMKEKRAAIDAWAAWLQESPSAKVTPIRKK